MKTRWSPSCNCCEEGPVIVHSITQRSLELHDYESGTGTQVFWGGGLFNTGPPANRGYWPWSRFNELFPPPDIRSYGMVFQLPGTSVPIGVSSAVIDFRGSDDPFGFGLVPTVPVDIQIVVLPYVGSGLNGSRPGADLSGGQTWSLPAGALWGQGNGSIVTMPNIAALVNLMTSAPGWNPATMFMHVYTRVTSAIVTSPARNERVYISAASNITFE